MITLKSNIEFLSADQWRDYTAAHIRKEDQAELVAHIDAAVDYLIILQDMLRAWGGISCHRNEESEIGKVFDTDVNNGELP